MGSKKSTQPFTETVENMVENTDINEKIIEIESPKKADESGVFAYLGPNIKGIITNGTIFSGAKSDFIASIKSRLEIAGDIDKITLISRLIIRDTSIMSAKEKIKDGGNALSEAYKKISEI